MASPSYGLASDVMVARPLAIEHRRGVASSVREFPDPELTKGGASTAVAASARHAEALQVGDRRGEWHDMVSGEVRGGAADAAPGLFGDRELCTSPVLIAVAACRVSAAGSQRPPGATKATITGSSRVRYLPEAWSVRSPMRLRRLQATMVCSEGGDQSCPQSCSRGTSGRHRRRSRPRHLMTSSAGG